MDAVVVEVEPERLGFAVAQGEGGGCFGGVGEPEQLGRGAARRGCVAMSRRTPPAPIAASCWSSPTSRTLRAAVDDELRRRCRGRGCRPCRPRR